MNKWKDVKSQSNLDKSRIVEIQHQMMQEVQAKSRERTLLSVDEDILLRDLLRKASQEYKAEIMYALKRELAENPPNWLFVEENWIDKI